MIRNRALPAAVVWVALSLYAFDAARADYRKHYREGLEAIGESRWQEAAGHLSAALAERSTAGGLVRTYGVRRVPYLPHFYLGVALFELGKVGDAERRWRLSEEQGVVAEYPEQLNQLRKYRGKLAQRRETNEREDDRVVVDERSIIGDGAIEAVRTMPSFALVAGAGDYLRGWEPLSGARDDAEPVAAALRRQGFDVEVLPDPTGQELRDALTRLFFNAPVGDGSRVLFYFAGHGATRLVDGDELGYIVPVDAPLPEDDLGSFLATAISMSRFQTWARQSPARHAMLVFDSCFSGTVFRQVRSSPGGLAEDKVREKSRMFITAGAADQVVPDASHFRRAFVAALGGEADLDGDRILFGTELGIYIQDQVRERGRGIRNAQLPLWGRSGGHLRGDFPLLAAAAFD